MVDPLYQGILMTDRKLLQPIRSKKVTDYVLQYYFHQGHCSLCGNSGSLDTSGVKTPTGLEVGRRNYCLCPNGQAARKEAFVETGDIVGCPE